MSILATPLLKNSHTDDNPNNLQIKFSYWVKKLYRFSESELKDCFGNSYNKLVEENLLQISAHDQYYYCNPQVLKTIGDGDYEGAIFYSSLTMAQLKQITPTNFHHGSKNDIITRLVREHYAIFPETKNIDSLKINEIITTLYKFTDIRFSHIFFYLL